MRTFFFSIFTILFSLTVFNQNQDIQWQKCYGGSNNDVANSIIQITEGGYFFSGYTESLDGDVSGNHGESDYWAVKIDEVGNIIWSKCLGGSNIDRAWSVIQTNDNSYILAGSSNSEDGDVSGNHGGYDFWIVKLDDGGSLQWQKCFGGSQIDEANCIAQTNDDGYIIAGTTNSNDFDVTNNHGDADGWIVKTNGNGEAEWMKCFGGSAYDEIRFVQPTSDNGYIAAGSSTSDDGDVGSNYGMNDFWVVKIDSLGYVQWHKAFGGSQYEVAYSVLQTADSGYIVSGFTNSNDFDVNGNHGEIDLWVIKLNYSGSLEWQKCLGGSESEGSLAINQTKNVGYILSGPSRSADGDVEKNYGINDYWVIEIDSYGEMKWQNTFGGSENDSPKSVFQTNDDGFIAAGSSSSNDWDVSGNHGSSDCWIVKLNPSIGISKNIQNTKIIIFPNPAHSFITFELPKQYEKSMLEIIDVYGNVLIKAVLNNPKEVIDVQTLRAGFYIYTLRAKDLRKKGKIVIRK